MDQEKIKTVLEWETPWAVKQVQSFLGLAKFYRHIIEAYSKVTRPITELTMKCEKFKWNSDYERAFKLLKEHSTLAPILRHF